jgi:hypothetical protein
VASRSVGFEIYNSGKLSEKDFACFIHLWGNSGPNWLFEEKKYYKEQELEWTIVQKKKGSVFQRLSFPKKNSNSNVFGRLSFPAVFTPSNIEPSNGSTGKSYAQVVKNKVLTPTINSRNYRANSSGNDGFVYQQKRHFPALPGLLPFMKFTTFKAPDSIHWPNDSFRNWFKGHDPVIEAITAHSFNELTKLSSLAPSAAILATSSSSSAIVNPSPCPLQSSPLSTKSSQDQAVMANIPINPEPFVPNGFQIVHVDGRTAVHRVVLPRRGRKMKISPLPPLTRCPKVRFISKTSVMF